LEPGKPDTIIKEYRVYAIWLCLPLPP
jgi:hypothetical protein